MKQKVLLASAAVATAAAVLGSVSVYQGDIKLAMVAWIWAAVGLCVFFVGLVYPK